MPRSFLKGSVRSGRKAAPTLSGSAQSIGPAPASGLAYVAGARPMRHGTCGTTPAFVSLPGFPGRLSACGGGAGPFLFRFVTRVMGIHGTANRRQVPASGPLARTRADSRSRGVHGERDVRYRGSPSAAPLESAFAPMAPVEAKSTGAGKGIMCIHDCDPYDYACTERNFLPAPGVQVEIKFTLGAAGANGTPGSTSRFPACSNCGHRCGNECSSSRGKGTTPPRITRRKPYFFFLPAFFAGGCGASPAAL